MLIAETLRNARRKRWTVPNLFVQDCSLMYLQILASTKMSSFFIFKTHNNKHEYPKLFHGLFSFVSLIYHWQPLQVQDAFLQWNHVT